MYQLTEWVRIDRPSADVWAILIDFPNVPTWENDVLEVRQTSPGPRPLAPRSSPAASSVDGRASSTAVSPTGRMAVP